MNLDIRLPLGMMFTIFGVLLVGYGALSDGSIYQRSLGVNMNLWWGGVLLILGVVTLVFAIRSRGSASTPSD